MGIALKRRDNAPIVKTIMGGDMKMLLDHKDVNGAFDFVKLKCMELVSGKVSLNQLTVTKSLRADYADPTRIAHKVLAERITQRDPGNAPASGDRIGYVYIRPKTGQLASVLQGDRIETPQFIRTHSLIPDYRHYIEHQLQNPISQTFALLLESIPGFKSSMMLKCPIDDTDKIMSYRESIASELLFTECLAQFEKDSTAYAMKHMFGISPKNISKLPKISLPSTPSTTPVRTIIPKQTSMSDYLLDSFLMASKKTVKATKPRKDAKDTKDTK